MRNSRLLVLIGLVVTIILILLGARDWQLFDSRTSSGSSSSNISSESSESSASSASSASSITSESPEVSSITIKIPVIALEDAGASGKPVGCNDSVVFVDQEIPTTQSVLTAAYEALLARKENEPYGRHNALAQSSLAVDSTSVIDGHAMVKLTGEMTSSGVCDDPRIIAQLEEAALQFPGIDSVTVLINGKDVHDVLSLK